MTTDGNKERETAGVEVMGKVAACSGVLARTLIKVGTCRRPSTIQL